MYPSSFVYCTETSYETCQTVDGGWLFAVGSLFRFARPSPRRRPCLAKFSYSRTCPPRPCPTRPRVSSSRSGPRPLGRGADSHIRTQCESASRPRRRTASEAARASGRASRGPAPGACGRMTASLGSICLIFILAVRVPCDPSALHPLLQGTRAPEPRAPEPRSLFLSCFPCTTTS